MKPNDTQEMKLKKTIATVKRKFVGNRHLEQIIERLILEESTSK